MMENSTRMCLLPIYLNSFFPRNLFTSVFILLRQDDAIIINTGFYSAAARRDVEGAAVNSEYWNEKRAAEEAKADAKIARAAAGGASKATKATKVPRGAPVATVRGKDAKASAPSAPVTQSTSAATTVVDESAAPKETSSAPPSEVPSNETGAVLGEEAKASAAVTQSTSAATTIFEESTAPKETSSGPPSKVPSNETGEMKLKKRRSAAAAKAAAAAALSTHQEEATFQDSHTSSTSSAVPKEAASGQVKSASTTLTAPDDQDSSDVDSADANAIFAQRSKKRKQTIPVASASGASEPKQRRGASAVHRRLSEAQQKHFQELSADTTRCREIAERCHIDFLLLNACSANIVKEIFRISKGRLDMRSELPEKAAAYASWGSAYPGLFPLFGLPAPPMCETYVSSRLPDRKRLLEHLADELIKKSV